MDEKGKMNTGEYEELIKEVEANSPYKRLSSAKKKWMSVSEMGELLGLKKTDRYWLVHKNFFETKEIAGKMRVNIESFEKWYANQIKYHKVNGEEPGKELKEWSYSVPELAEMLEVTDGVVYDLIKRNNIEVVIVDYWKRVPKAAFQKWYDGQSRYRTKDDKKRDAEMEAATLTMPEMARQLGITRNQVYGILNSQKYQHFFEFVTIADRKRITKESFQKFLDGQDEYHLDPANDYEELAMEEFWLLHLAYLLMQLEIGCICFGISAFIKRGSIGIGLGLALALYFMNIICNISEKADFLKYITPYAYADASNIISESELEGDLIFIGVLISIAGILTAILKYTKKDISG